MVASAALFGERLGTLFAAGAVLILAGLALAVTTRRKGKRGQIAGAMSYPLALAAFSR